MCQSPLYGLDELDFERDRCKDARRRGNPYDIPKWGTPARDCVFEVHSLRFLAILLANLAS